MRMSNLLSLLLRHTHSATMAASSLGVLTTYTQAPLVAETTVETKLSKQEMQSNKSYRILTMRIKSSRKVASS